MTDKQKKTAGITLASLVAAVILAASAWPHILPALNWIAPIFGREQVQAVLAAIAGGTLLGVWLPRTLPTSWPPARTKLLTGASCSLVTLGLAVALVPTRIGTVYAVLAAIATPTVSQAVAGAWYWVRPCAKPGSLKP